MFRRTDDLRITQTRPLLPPAILLEELPITERASNVVANARQAIADVRRSAAIRGSSSSSGPAPSTTPRAAARVRASASRRWRSATRTS